MWVKEALGKGGLRRSINEITGILYVHLPISYSLSSSLFWQKCLGSPSPFNLFWVDVLVRLWPLISWHCGYPFQAAERNFWKHCWHQDIRSVSCCCLAYFCQCKFCFLLRAGHGWLFPISCFFWLSKGVFLSSFSYTIIRGLLASNVIEVLLWMCAYSEPWDLTMMCLSYEAFIWIPLCGPLLHLVGMDSQVALPWVRRGRWVSFGHLLHFYMELILHMYSFSDKVLLWHGIGLVPKETEMSS